MKVFWIIIYNLFLYPLFFTGACIGALFNQKLRNGIKGRWNTYSQLLSFKNRVSSNADIYWFHAASHGEFEQLKPILEGLKEVEPSSVFIVSFFSPSGFTNVEDSHIDCKIYLPFDFPWTVMRALKLICPKKIIFAEYDVWPNMVWIAKLKNIPTTIFSVHFSNYTPKLFPVIRNFYRTVYGALSHIYSETKSDYKKVHRLIGTTSIPKVKVLGNPRYDQVKKKTDQFTEKRTLSVLLRKKRIIAGSVWREDEDVILQSLTRFLKEDKSAALIWVPHEPNQNNIDRAYEYFTSVGLTTTIHTEKNIQISEKEQVVIIGVVGILSSLYWDGQLAYVGGGFSSGVHNVMEPAIARLPVLFGPKFDNSHAAKELILEHGGYSITSSEEFRSKLDSIFTDKNFFLRSSFSATNVIHKNLGSSTRIVRAIIKD